MQTQNKVDKKRSRHGRQKFAHEVWSQKEIREYNFFNFSENNFSSKTIFSSKNNFFIENNFSYFTHFRPFCTMIT